MRAEATLVVVGEGVVWADTCGGLDPIVSWRELTAATTFDGSFGGFVEVELAGPGVEFSFVTINASPIELSGEGVALSICVVVIGAGGGGGGAKTTGTDSGTDRCVEGAGGDNGCAVTSAVAGEELFRIGGGLGGGEKTIRTGCGPVAAA